MILIWDGHCIQMASETTEVRWQRKSSQTHRIHIKHTYIKTCTLKDFGHVWIIGYGLTVHFHALKHWKPKVTIATFIIAIAIETAAVAHSEICNGIRYFQRVCRTETHNILEGKVLTWGSCVNWIPTVRTRQHAWFCCCCHRNMVTWEKQNNQVLKRWWCIHAEWILKR